MKQLPLIDSSIGGHQWLYLLAFTLPFGRIPSYELALGAHSVVIRASFVVAAIAVTAGLLSALRQRSLVLSAPDKWLVAYIVAMIASAAGAISVGRSMQVIVATTLVIGLAMVVERTLVHFSLARIYIVLLSVAVITCVLGLLQFFGDSFGLPTSVTGLREAYTKAVLGFPRIQSVALEPLFFASFLLLPLLLQVARLYSRRSGWAAYAVLWLLVMVLALTLSRGGIYAGLGGLIALLVLLRSKDNYRRLVPIAATIVVGAACALGLIQFMVNTHRAAPESVQTYSAQVTTIASSPRSRDPDRFSNRIVAWEAFAERPVLGVGIGNFGVYAYARQSVWTPKAVVNNEYLEILAETGIVGMLALLGFVLALGRQMVQAWPALAGDQRVWAATLCAVLFADAIQFWAFSPLYLIHIWFAIGLLLAITGVVQHKPYEEGRVAHRLASNFASLVASLRWMRH